MTQMTQKAWGQLTGEEKNQGYKGSSIPFEITGLEGSWLWSGSPSSQGWSLPQCPSAPEMGQAQSLLAEIQLPFSLTPLGTRRCRGQQLAEGNAHLLGLSPIRTPSQGPRYTRIAPNLSGS